MTEQERPRTEADTLAGMVMIAVAERQPVGELLLQLRRAERTEGRQQAVREIRAEISKGLQGDVQAALDRLAESPMAHRGHDEGRSHPECIACQRVAGLNDPQEPADG